LVFRTVKKKTVLVVVMPVGHMFLFGIDPVFCVLVKCAVKFELVRSFIP
jgi:hypothetical protein